MTSCFVLAGETGNDELEAGLAGILPARNLAIGALSQPGVGAIEPGSVCLLTGRVLGGLPSDQRAQLASATLARGAHLIMLPPFGANAIPSIVPGLAPVYLSDSGNLGPVSIVDDDLASACGVRELTLLYTQAVEFAPARRLVVAADGGPVAVRYRHSSNWGELVVSTLLLASSSGRSLRAHRIALAKGLVTWLAGQRQPATEPAEPIMAALSARELALALLALARQPAPSQPSALMTEISAIRSRLGEPQTGLALDQVVEWLHAAGIVIPAGPDDWQVDSGRLAAELARRHLGAYVRRLI